MNWHYFNHFWPTFFETVTTNFGSWPNKNFKKWRSEDLTWAPRFESTKKPMETPPSANINSEFYQEFLKNSKIHNQK